jgi:hypothetical protein
VKGETPARTLAAGLGTCPGQAISASPPFELVQITEHSSNRATCLESMTSVDHDASLLALRSREVLRVRS